MSEQLTEQQKFVRKSLLLQRALAEADKIDKADEKKAAAAKAKNKLERVDRKGKQAEQDKVGAERVLPDS